MDTISFLAYVCLALGGFFLLSGVVGMLRFPNFITRVHAAGVADSAGAPLILLGIALLVPGLSGLKIALLVIFMAIAAATACHALMQASQHEEKE